LDSDYNASWGCENPSYESTGERITHPLASGESEKAVAKRLTLKLLRSERGDEMAGFHKTINYPKWGGA
jgi:hypothetical protein